jgi:hypothetical protein
VVTSDVVVDRKMEVEQRKEDQDPGHEGIAGALYRREAANAPRNGPDSTAPPHHLQAIRLARTRLSGLHQAPDFNQSW